MARAMTSYCVLASRPETRTDWLDEVLRERGDLFEIDAATHGQS